MVMKPPVPGGGKGGGRVWVTVTGCGLLGVGEGGVGGWRGGPLPSSERGRYIPYQYGRGFLSSRMI